MYSFFQDGENILLENIEKPLLHEDYMSSCVIFPNVHKFVTTGWGDGFKIWDLETQELIHQGDVEEVSHVIKWDDETFIICEKTIRSISIHFPTSKQVVFDLEEQPNKIHKIGKDILLAALDFNLVSVSYSKQSVVRCMCKDSKTKFADTEICSSKKHPNEYFFVCCQLAIDLGGKVLYVKSDDLTIKETYRGNWKSSKKKVLTVNSYISKTGDEILVFGGYNQELLFYNTSITGGNEILLKSVEFENTIYTSLCLGNEYIVVGDNCGTMYVVDIDKGKEIGNCRLHDNGIWDMKFLPNYKNNLNQVTIFTCSFDYSLRVVNLDGLKCKLSTNTMEITDLEERLDFLRNERKLYIHDNMEENYFFCISLTNIRIEKSFRVLFL